MNFEKLPSPPSARSSNSSRGNNNKLPKRPLSANPKLRGAKVKDTKVDAAVINKDESNNLLALSKDDLISTVISLKKDMRSLENQLSFLKVENQRIESENSKQQRRIEKILGANASGQSSSDIRKEIEKSILIRQMKAQVNSLRILISDKDIEIQDLKKNIKTTTAAELMAEKEEYYLEIIRLRKLVNEKAELLKSESQNREWEKAVSVGKENDLRNEIDRLSLGYHELLCKLGESNYTIDSTKSKQQKLSKQSSNKSLAIKELPVSTQPATAKGSKTIQHNTIKDLNIYENLIIDEMTTNKPEIAPLEYNISTDKQIDTSDTNNFYKNYQEDSFDQNNNDDDFFEADSTIDAKGKVTLEASPLLGEYEESSTSSPIKFNFKYEVGARVEGMFRGGERWYSCIIKSRNHSNNTYQLVYDDGDEESNVPEKFLRNK